MQWQSMFSIRPSNLSSAQRLAEHLTLADKARANPELVPNHRETVVVHWLECFLDETQEILAIGVNDPVAMDAEFKARLERERSEVRHALSAYVPY